MVDVVMSSSALAIIVKVIVLVIVIFLNKIELPIGPQ